MSRKLVLVMTLTFVLMGMLGVAVKVQRVKASGTIYINADGSVVPSTANITSLDNVTYTFTDNINDSIVVYRDNIVVDGAGYTLQGTGSGTGIDLSGRSNVTIKNMEIKAFYYGIYLWHSSNNTIYGNNITNNEEGIRLYEDTHYNTVSGNNIEDNTRGIALEGSSNFIYHNNFVDNTEQVYILYSYPNVWDDGYPSGGNYWSNYNGTDLFSGLYQNENGSDGIGDTSYDIDVDNQDRFPLMGRIYIFDVGIWDARSCQVHVINYPTYGHVHDFQLNTTQRTIRFNASAVPYVQGFCRITIPNIIVQEMWEGDYTVLEYSLYIHGEPIKFRNWTDTENTYIFFFLYFWRCDRIEVVMVPEFPSALILPLFMIATLLAVIIYRRKHPM